MNDGDWDALLKPRATSRLPFFDVYTRALGFNLLGQLFLGLALYRDAHGWALGFYALAAAWYWTTSYYRVLGWYVPGDKTVIQIPIRRWR